MTDPMHDRCPALEPGTGERCVLYAKHISDRSGVHVATGSWPVEAEGSDEELTALVTDAIAVGDVARRYARIYDRDPMTVLAAVEATLHVIEHRQPVEGSTPLDSPPRPWPRGMAELLGYDADTEPAGEVVSVPPPARVEVEVKLLQILYDMVVGSLDWGSGFFDGDDVTAVHHVGRLLGIEDSEPPTEREPHLWHQDCALPWRCGQSAGAEIHRMEMPSV